MNFLFTVFFIFHINHFFTFFFQILKSFFENIAFLAFLLKKVRKILKIQFFLLFQFMYNLTDLFKIESFISRVIGHPNNQEWLNIIQFGLFEKNLLEIHHLLLLIILQKTTFLLENTDVKRETRVVLEVQQNEA